MWLEGLLELLWWFVVPMLIPAALYRVLERWLWPRQGGGEGWSVGLCGCCVGPLSTHGCSALRHWVRGS